jgi:hypothetical protein
MAWSTEEKAACESEPKGHEDQAENNGKDLGALGWSGHSGIIELSSMGTEPDSNVLITPVTGLRFVPKGFSWPIDADNTVSSGAGSVTGTRLAGNNRLLPSSALAPRLDQGKQSCSLPTPRWIASVKVMRIPCSGRKITIGRASIVWPGTRRKSYFLSRTPTIMRICSMA